MRKLLLKQGGGRRSLMRRGRRRRLSLLPRLSGGLMLVRHGSMM
jgi:hypothetical protein